MAPSRSTRVPSEASSSKPGWTRGALAGLTCLVALAAFAPAAGAAVAKTRSLGGGAWCWFADPRALHHEGVRNQTFLGWIDREGDVKVASYDHVSKVRTTVVLHERLGVDDHNNPALHVRPDGRVMAFYSEHNGAAMYYRVSRWPEDITSWGRERRLPTNTTHDSSGSRRAYGFTYPNPLRLREEPNRLWLFWRGGSSWPTFSSSPDGGRTWERARNLIANPHQRPYVKFAGNGRDRVHVAFTQGHPVQVNSNIYYARYRDGNLYRANGARIKPMSRVPLSPSEADKVYDTSSKAWIHDVAHDSAERPVIVFAAIDDSGEHHYRYARWTGRSWRWYRMVSAGRSIADYGKEPYYSGGITLDHENPSVVYLSRQVGGEFEIETWRTPDGGRTWSRNAVTSSSSTENVRPVSPRGLADFGSEMGVLWMRGRYVHYLDYRTDITARLLNGGNRPPIADASATPRSGDAPLSVRFDGTGSHDPDGSIVDWSWRFGDGSRGRGSRAWHTFRSPGRYFARLTVTDDSGDRDVFVSEVVVR